MAKPINIPTQVDELEIFTTNLHRLMQAKGLSEAELARKSNIPQSTLHKVISGKTDDPRTSTLKALAHFFEISIDELLTGMDTPRQTSTTTKTQSIAIISWDECTTAISFIKDLTTMNWHSWIAVEYSSKNAYGLVSKSSMEPCFPKGTVLIIDPNIRASDGDMVIVQYPNTQEATLRKLSTDGPTKLLLPINANASHDNLKDDIKILGVLVKSIFSFHA
jgi:SOS-response transcriptional repressor LexA